MKISDNPSNSYLESVNLSFFRDTGSDANLLVVTPRRLDRAGQRYKLVPCPPQVTVGDFVKGTSTAHERVVIRRIVLETASGHLEVQNVHFFLVPGSPEIILGTYFTQDIGFNAPAWLSDIFNEINGNNLEGPFWQFPGGTLRWIRSMENASACDP